MPPVHMRALPGPPIRRLLIRGLTQDVRFSGHLKRQARSLLPAEGRHVAGSAETFSTRIVDR